MLRKSRCQSSEHTSTRWIPQNNLKFSLHHASIEFFAKFLWGTLVQKWFQNTQIAGVGWGFKNDNILDGLLRNFGLVFFLCIFGILYSRYWRCATPTQKWWIKCQARSLFLMNILIILLTEFITWLWWSIWWPTWNTEPKSNTAFAVTCYLAFGFISNLVKISQ